MRFGSVEDETSSSAPVLLRKSSFSEVPEKNSVIGRYSYVEDNSGANYTPSVTSSSSFTVKSKSCKYSVASLIKRLPNFYTFSSHYQ